MQSSTVSYLEIIIVHVIDVEEYVKYVNIKDCRMIDMVDVAVILTEG